MPVVSEELAIPFILGGEARAVTASEEPRHLSSPFTITANGALTVEQGTPEDITQCVYRVAVFPEGYREDLPQYGVPELAFEAIPLDLATYEAALNLWEPRAELESSEMAEGIQAARKVAVGVR